MLYTILLACVLFGVDTEPIFVKLSLQPTTVPQPDPRTFVENIHKESQSLQECGVTSEESSAKTDQCSKRSQYLDSIIPVTRCTTGLPENSPDHLFY